jgi:heterotetrameric sarcosine oxidase gamma subunit
VTDQSDGKAILRISGPHTRDRLAKGFHFDLDPRVFKSGDTAIAAGAYINVHLCQIDDSPTYDAAMFRSFATAFYEWLCSSVAEYGVATRAS